MVRPIARTGRISRPGACPCGHRFSADDRVLQVRTWGLVCEHHRSLFLPDAVQAAGRYAELRRGPRPD